MFERIKNFFSGIGLAVKYGDTIRNITTIWNRFPGLADSETLRLWIRPLLTDAASLALLTKTTIDDIVIQAAVKVIDNNNAWNLVYSLILLIHNGVGFDVHLISCPDESDEAGVFAREGDHREPDLAGPKATAVKGHACDIFEMGRKIAEETMPECPAAVISAIGIILFVIHNRNTGK